MIKSILDYLSENQYNNIALFTPYVFEKKIYYA